MAIFVISAIDINVPDTLKVTIEENVDEDDRVELNPFSWLVSFNGTAAEISEKLVIPNVGLAKALVVHADKFSGYGPLTIQKWIKAHGGRERNKTR